MLAQITQVFGEYDVSLESVVQSPDEQTQDAEIIIVTHHASKANMDKVLKHFETLKVIRRIKSVYRVEG
ncbi:homoserine dehydrogenase [compost metagenome]